MNYVNLTPYPIRLNDGRVFEPSGQVARISTPSTVFIGDIGISTCGEVSGLPAPAEETMYIVNGMVLTALAGSRRDVVAPATGHPECVRNDAGRIVSVPCFTQ